MDCMVALSSFQVFLRWHPLSQDQIQQTECCQYANHSQPSSRLFEILEFQRAPPQSVIPSEDQDFTPLDDALPLPVKSNPLQVSEKEDFGMGSRVTSILLKSWTAVPTAVTVYLNLMPKIRAHAHPFGGGVSEENDGELFAKSLEGMVKLGEIASDLARDAAELSTLSGEYEQRRAERQLEVNDLGFAIKTIDKQVLVQQELAKLAQTDINNQNKIIKLAQDVEQVLADQHLNLAMWTWLDNSLQKIYYETYTIVYDLAKKAEKAYRFELGIGQAVPSIIDSGYWDLNHDGAYADERLYNALKRLQTAYDETRTFDFEISKTISLRQLDVTSLMKLRNTGSCTWTLPELLFDLDFPGQIRRRIGSVSVSLQGVTAPSIASALTLAQHRYRLNDFDNGFQSDNIPINAVAISAPMGDNGTSLDFSANSFLPFEVLAGAVSTWSFRLSPFSSLGPASISDLTINLRYTSTAGNTTFQKKQIESVQKALKESTANTPGGMGSTFDLSLDFDSNMWKSFSSGANPRSFRLSGILRKLPYFAQVNNATLVTSQITHLALVTDKETADAGSRQKF